MPVCEPKNTTTSLFWWTGTQRGPAGTFEGFHAVSHNGRPALADSAAAVLARTCSVILSMMLRLLKRLPPAPFVLGTPTGRGQAEPARRN